MHPRNMVVNNRPLSRPISVRHKDCILDYDPVVFRHRNGSAQLSPSTLRNFGVVNAYDLGKCTGRWGQHSKSHVWVTSGTVFGSFRWSLTVKSRSQCASREWKVRQAVGFSRVRQSRRRENGFC